MPAALSRRAYARTRDISEAAVRAHIKSGVLAAALTPDGLIDPIVADAALRATLRRPKATKAPPVLQMARARHARVTAARLGDELADSHRALVEPALAEREVFGPGRRVLADDIRTALRNLPSHVVGLAADEIQRVVKRAVNSALAYTHEENEKRLAAHRAKPPAAEQQVDLEALSPVELEALIVDRRAEIAERELALARGDLAEFEMLNDAFVECLVTFKGLLISIPGRVDQRLAFATLAEAERVITTEINLALESLKETPHEDRP